MQDIQVISLRRTPERRAAFAALHGHLRYAFFDAVDGNVVSTDVLFDYRLFEPGLRYSPGAVGCALSHHALWERAEQAAAPLTVAEDDAIFRLDFAAQSQQAIERLPPGWDIVMWGWNFDAVMALGEMPGIAPLTVLSNQNELRRNIEPFRALEGPANLLRIHRCFGTPAYTISPGGAARLRRLCFPLRSFSLFYPVLNRPILNTGIDIALNRAFAEANAYVSLPPLAVTRNENERSTTLHR
jgi:glycosyl transferase family 25